MPKYYTQKFENPTAGGDTVFYGVQAEHNHDASNEFSKAAIDWLVAKAKWKKSDIRSGKFMSGQGKPAAGKELKYDAKSKKWSKA